MKNIEKTLIRESRASNVLVLWLDCDREGENITFEVIEICKKANPRLEIYRAHFSAVIPREVFRAWQNLAYPNEKDSLAVDVRMELDLKIGAAFTRFQTKRLQSKFSGLQGDVISYGNHLKQL
jgi:DNA topoisomerase-3